VSSGKHIYFGKISNTIQARFLTIHPGRIVFQVPFLYSLNTIEVKIGYIETEMGTLP